MSKGKVTGRVKFFSGKGRFGFIYPDQGTGEIYFREQDCLKDVTSLDEGDRVEFSIVSGMKGPRALFIRKLSGDQGDR